MDFILTYFSWLNVWRKKNRRQTIFILPLYHNIVLIINDHLLCTTMHTLGSQCIVSSFSAVIFDIYYSVTIIIVSISISISKYNYCLAFGTFHAADLEDHFDHVFNFTPFSIRIVTKFVSIRLNISNNFYLWRTRLALENTKLMALREKLIFHKEKHWFSH